MSFQRVLIPSSTCRPCPQRSQLPAPPIGCRIPSAFAATVRTDRQHGSSHGPLQDRSWARRFSLPGISAQRRVADNCAEVPARIVPPPGRHADGAKAALTVLISVSTPLFTHCQPPATTGESHGHCLRDVARGKEEPTWRYLFRAGRRRSSQTPRLSCRRLCLPAGRHGPGGDTRASVR